MRLTWELPLLLHWNSTPLCFQRLKCCIVGCLKCRVHRPARLHFGYCQLHIKFEIGVEYVEIARATANDQTVNSSAWSSVERSLYGSLSPFSIFKLLPSSEVERGVKVNVALGSVAPDWLVSPDWSELSIAMRSVYCRSESKPARAVRPALFSIFNEPAPNFLVWNLILEMVTRFSFNDCSRNTSVHSVKWAYSGSARSIVMVTGRRVAAWDWWPQWCDALTAPWARRKYSLPFSQASALSLGLIQLFTCVWLTQSS